MCLFYIRIERWWQLGTYCSQFCCSSAGGGPYRWSLPSGRIRSSVSIVEPLHCSSSWSRPNTSESWGWTSTRNASWESCGGSARAEAALSAGATQATSLRTGRAHRRFTVTSTTKTCGKTSASNQNLAGCGTLRTRQTTVANISTCMQTSSHIQITMVRSFGSWFTSRTVSRKTTPRTCVARRRSFTI